jgi:hypothetical protein
MSSEPDDGKPGYEFTADQNRLITSLAGLLRDIGFVLIAFGVLQVFQGLLDLPKGAVAIVEGLVFISIGALKRRAAAAFRQLVQTEGDDIPHLMRALTALAGVFRIQVILIIVVIGTVIVAGLVAVLTHL